MLRPYELPNYGFCSQNDFEATRVYVPCELSPRITVPTERPVETFVVDLATRVNILTSLGNGTEGTVAKFNVAMAYAYNPCTCVVIVPVAGSRHVRYWCECFCCVQHGSHVQACGVHVGSRCGFDALRAAPRDRQPYALSRKPKRRKWGYKLLIDEQLL